MGTGLGNSLGIVPQMLSLFVLFLFCFLFFSVRILGWWELLIWFLFFKKNILNFVSVLTCTHVNECRCLRRPKVLDRSGAGIAGGCKPCDLGAGNQIPSTAIAVWTLKLHEEGACQASVRNRVCEDQSSSPEPMCIPGGCGDSPGIPGDEDGISRASCLARLTGIGQFCVQ